MRIAYKIILTLAGFFIFSLLSFVLASKVEAATYCNANPEGNCYVDGSVGASGNGKTPVTAFKTIQEAAGVVGPGDTVNVKGGITYSEKVTPAVSGTSGNVITYKSWVGTGIPLIDASGEDAGMSVLYKNYLKISGFEIINVNQGGIPAGIACYGGISNILINNIIHDNLGYGIFASNYTGIFIYNNTIFNNSSSGLNMGYLGGSGAVLRNNIVMNSGDFGLASNSANVVINHDYNLYLNNPGFPGLPEWGTDYMEINNIFASPHDVHQDPLFLDLLSNDFRIPITSPAKDTGDTLTDILTDIIGVPRPQGSAYDIGAYEYYVITITLTPETFITYDTSTPTFTGTAATVSPATIALVEYSLDGGTWTALGVSAADGAFDESEEEYTITIPYELSEGEHTIQVRATDSYGNTTYFTMYANLEFEIELPKLPETGMKVLLPMISHFLIMLVFYRQVIVITRKFKKKWVFLT
ncbi:MAG: choice-of-anchor Q domain-containing protein [Patescibacteria group bacterium]|nr:right-handed parallel beta-helix repeat-containing protein [Patescibacteria group bacterium]